jgi:hypothetical protein
MVNNEASNSLPAKYRRSRDQRYSRDFFEEKGIFEKWDVPNQGGRAKSGPASGNSNGTGQLRRKSPVDSAPDLREIKVETSASGRADPD